jgi:trigger factor
MEVHDRILHELNDEFAQKFGKVDTMVEMRQNIRTELESIAENNAKDAAETQMIDKIVASSTIDYPAVLIDEEVNDEIQGLLADLKRRQIEVDDYLNQIGQTADELTKTISARADVRIRRGLVLGDVAKRENLLITEEDIDKEVAERAKQQDTSPESMRAYLDANKEIDNVRNVAQTKKVLGFLSGSAIITVKSPGEMSSSKPTQTAKKTSKPKNTVVAAEAETPAKPRTRKKKTEEPVAE